MESIAHHSMLRGASGIYNFIPSNRAWMADLLSYHTIHSAVLLCACVAIAYASILYHDKQSGTSHLNGAMISQFGMELIVHVAHCILAYENQQQAIPLYVIGGMGLLVSPFFTSSSFSKLTWGALPYFMVHPMVQYALFSDDSMICHGLVAVFVTASFYWAAVSLIALLTTHIQFQSSEAHHINIWNNAFIFGTSGLYMLVMNIDKISPAQRWTLLGYSCILSILSIIIGMYDLIPRHNLRLEEESANSDCHRTKT